MEETRYSNTHEWIRIEGNVGFIGISDYAQHALGAIVFVELPRIGQTFKKGTEFGAVESVKSASELFMPMSGKVIEVNTKLIDHPELVNSDPLGQWFMKVSIEKSSEFQHLLTLAQYKLTLK
jgi:glycine cleavage system H protein